MVNCSVTPKQVSIYNCTIRIIAGMLCSFAFLLHGQLEPSVVRLLRWFFCLLGHGSFHFVLFTPPFLGALIYLWLAGFHHSGCSLSACKKSMFGCRQLFQQKLVGEASIWLWEGGEIWIGELKLSRSKWRNKWNVWLKFLGTMHFSLMVSVLQFCKCCFPGVNGDYC